jgi:deferrochelatase/peroxidase EfeB
MRPSRGVPIAERGPGWSYRPDEAPASLYARRQPGVATPRLDHLAFAVFDLQAGAGDVLPELTRAAEELLSPQLTVTLGLGPGVFTQDTRPVALRALPAFAGDALRQQLCGGDLALQICAARADEAAAAADRLSAVAGGALSARWRQNAALRREAGDHAAGTPRDPLGFRDGTHNLRRGRDLDRHVWVHRGDRTGMVDGTYLVVRRIEIAVDAWNELGLDAQEQVIGRHRDTGAPLGGRREFDPAPLERFPPGSHVRLAAPRTNAAPPMVRRSYSFDGGLLFIAFMRDPHRQFVPVQRRLAEHDRLSAYTRHTGSAVFAVPPGARAGGFVGDRLLEPAAR